MALRCPTCPWCGRAGRGLPRDAGRLLRLCETKGCMCLAWDPRLSPAQAMAQAVDRYGRPVA
jgi:hypothetical protein